jgi:hypothetical protein
MGGIGCATGTMVLLKRFNSTNWVPGCDFDNRQIN